MKITSKGQVTIPLPIRRRLDLRPGTEVEFVAAEGGRVFVRKARARRRPAALWLERATGTAKGRVTTDEILRLTRGEA